MTQACDSQNFLDFRDNVIDIELTAIKRNVDRHHRGMTTTGALRDKPTFLVYIDDHHKIFKYHISPVYRFFFHTD